MASDFFHSDLGYLEQGSVVAVKLANRANVLLLDTSNFQRYRRADGFNYYGGEARRSPYRVVVPHSGHWHLVLDLDGAAGTIRCEVAVLRQAAA